MREVLKINDVLKWNYDKQWRDFLNGRTSLNIKQIKRIEDILGIEYNLEHYTVDKPVSPSQRDMINIQQDNTKSEGDKYSINYLAFMFYKDKLIPSDFYLVDIYKMCESSEKYETHEVDMNNYGYTKGRTITMDDDSSKSTETFADCILKVFESITKDKSINTNGVLVEFFVPPELFDFDWGCLKVPDGGNKRIDLGKLYPFVIRPSDRFALGEDCDCLRGKHEVLVKGCGKWIVNGGNLISFKNKSSFVAIKQIEPPSDLGKWHNEVVRPMVPLAIWWFPYKNWPKIDSLDMKTKNPSAFLDHNDCKKLLKGDHGDQLQNLANYDKDLALLRYQLFDNSAGNINSVNYAARNLVIYVDHPYRPPPPLSDATLLSISLA
jgi:hypothetical protein